MFKCQTPEAFCQCLARHLEPDDVLKAFKLHRNITSSSNSNVECYFLMWYHIHCLRLLPLLAFNSVFPENLSWDPLRSPRFPEANYRIRGLRY